MGRKFFIAETTAARRLVKQFVVVLNAFFLILPEVGFPQIVKVGGNNVPHPARVLMPFGMLKYVISNHRRD